MKKHHRGEGAVSGDERAVTAVLGAALMVGVLVTVSVAVYLLLGQYEDASLSPDRRDGSFLVDRGPGDRGFRIQYVKGTAIPLDQGSILVTIDGTQTEHVLTEWASHTAEGSHWTAGEYVCIVGDGPGCLEATATTVEVFLVVEGDVMFQSKRTLAK